MSINRLSINNLRNISQMLLLPGPRLNFIFGENGSGKSSILEAIYLLGRGRSFRSPYNKKLISHGELSLTLFGELNINNIEHNLGVQIQNSSFRAKSNGSFLKKSSDLASIIPLLLITPDGDKLIKGSPKQRRRFIDWGLFHVEHQFLDAWQRYNRTLAHRNSSLRQGKKILEPWNIQLIQITNVIDSYRRNYSEILASTALDLFKELINIHSVEFKYQSGWGNDKTFEEVLRKSIDSDIKSGFTQKGTHKSDFIMFLNGKPAVEYLSGGQQKLAACALYLAQARLYSKKTDTPCLLLVDDLPSELDKKHRKALIDILYSIKGQVFITSTDIDTLELSNYEELTMFHVEHGQLIQ